MRTKNIKSLFDDSSILIYRKLKEVTDSLTLKLSKIVRNKENM